MQSFPITTFSINEIDKKKYKNSSNAIISVIIPFFLEIQKDAYLSKSGIRFEDDFSESFALMLASESVLKKEWDSEIEDSVWADL